MAAFLREERLKQARIGLIMENVSAAKTVEVGLPEGEAALSFRRPLVDRFIILPSVILHQRPVGVAGKLEADKTFSKSGSFICPKVP